MESLSAAQAAAVGSGSSRVLVAAGPGSGKTTVLVGRVEALILNGISSEDIVVVTYTNAAANEIASRLPSGLKLGHLGTIHSWALKLARRYGPDYFGTPDRFIVLDDVQWGKFLLRTAQEMGYKGSLKEIQRQDVALLERPKEQTNASLVLAEAQRRALRDGMVSYDMVLKLGLRVVQKLTADSRNACGALLVDEYQDCGADTHEICQIALADWKFLVGDGDQAVYSFAGGDPAAMLSLWGSDGWECLTLDASYRCNSKICAAAQSLIEHNKRRIPKRIVSAYEGDDGEPFDGVEYAKFQNSGQETNDIAAMVRNYTGRSRDPSGCAVLARTNFVAGQVAEALTRLGIPVATNNDAGSWSADWWLARLVVGFLTNPESDAAARMLLEAQRGADTAARMVLEAGAKFQTINEAFLRVPTGLPPLAAADAAGRMDCAPDSVAKIRQLASSLPPGAEMEDLSLAMAGREPVKRGDGVYCGTIHSAKGSEWDWVFIVGAEEGLLPSDAKGTDTEEERRLFYVGLTRARFRVVLTSCTARVRNAWSPMPVEAAPSRFIAEAGL